MRSKTLALVAGCAMSAAAHAQFINGDFQGGNLDNWGVRNTANGVGAPGDVLAVDIDGPGPLTSSPAAHFQAGQLVFTSGVQEGVEMTQELNLTAGTPYTFEFD